MDSSVNEIGRKTFLWYRVYCGVLILLYLAVTVLGVGLAVMRPETREYSGEEVFIAGILYAVVGALLFIVFSVAILLPAKPYNWIVGFVMMGIGMTSCCFVPFLIPLIIYWIKPETQAFFGRKQLT